MWVVRCGDRLPSRRSILSKEESFPNPLLAFYAILEASALLSINVVRFFFLLERTK